MKFFYAIILIVCLGCINFSCRRTIHGEGPIITEKRNIDGVKEIEISIPGNITFIEADSFGCIVGAQQNIVNAIKTKASGDELKIESDRNFDVDKPVQIVISLPKLNCLTVNGSGEVNGINAMNDQELSLELNGSGKIKLGGRIQEVKSEINGSGTVILDGKGNVIKTEINGSGDLHAYGFECSEAKVEITGSGDAELNVSDELKAAITGSGNVRYRGNPHVKTDITGSGNVQKD